jgi:hypothetical protein
MFSSYASWSVIHDHTYLNFSNVNTFVIMPHQFTTTTNA